MAMLHLFLGIFALVSFCLFIYRARHLISCISIGDREPLVRTNGPGTRLLKTSRYVLGQICSRKRPYTATGIMHTIIFWGFLFLIPTASEAVLRIIFPKFSFSFLGTFLYGTLTFLQDFMALGVMIAIIGATVRRFISKPDRVENHWDAPVILGLIAGVIITFFGMNMGEIALGATALRPITSTLHSVFGPSSVQTGKTLYATCWALHTLILLAFVPLLLYSKHLHILTGIPNIFLQNQEGFKQFRMDFEDSEFFGVNRIDQLSWKQLLDGYACTYCNRCTDQCPAHNTDKPLEPGKLIQNMRDILLEDAPSILNLRRQGKLSPPGEGEEIKPLIDRVITQDALWACTTCGACLQICPVLNEHPQKIIEMRRYLTLMEGNIPEELNLTFRNLENNYNPWGVGFADRANWAEGLNIPLLSEKGTAEYLLWVGCAGAYDERYKKVMKATVKILQAAKIDFAILGTEEKCCGDSARRLGNEYLFESLAMENAEKLKSYSVQKIITTCPHGYHTLKHEYPQYGWEGEVWHHTDFIATLIKKRKIKVSNAIPSVTVYHDSCYLGRHNNIYESPRYILKKLVYWKRIKEMNRSRELSFCCGAGGGRMWMEEVIGERINNVRTEEALAVDPEIIVTACPFCLTMFDDGLKAKDKMEEIELKDIAELVAGVIE